VENQDTCPVKLDQTSHILDFQAAAVKHRGRAAYTMPRQHLSCRHGHSLIYCFSQRYCWIAVNQHISHFKL